METTDKVATSTSLVLSREAYDELAAKLQATDRGHLVFAEGAAIDAGGLLILREEEPAVVLSDPDEVAALHHVLPSSDMYDRWHVAFIMLMAQLGKQEVTLLPRTLQGLDPSSGLVVTNDLFGVTVRVVTQLDASGASVHPDRLKMN